MRVIRRQTCAYQNGLRVDRFSSKRISPPRRKGSVGCARVDVVNAFVEILLPVSGSSYDDYAQARRVDNGSHIAGPPFNRYVTFLSFFVLLKVRRGPWPVELKQNDTA